MKNRLDAAREAREASEKQLTELQTAIAAERAARPESVNVAFPHPIFFHSSPFCFLSHVSALFFFRGCRINVLWQ
jgi:hypothetical protein